MYAFSAAFFNEIERMLKRKKVTVVLIISIISIIIAQLIIWGFRSGLGLRGANSAEFPLVVLPFFAGFILPLFTALVSIDTFADEYSSNTMKIALLRPVSRLKLFSAKICAIGAFALLNLLAVMVLSTISGLLFNASYITLGSMLSIFLSYTLTLVPIMVITLIIVLLCHFFKSSAGIFFLAVALFIISGVVVSFFPRFATLFITYNLSWYNLFIGDIQIFKILRVFLLMSGFGLMLFSAGYYFFDEKSH